MVIVYTYGVFDLLHPGHVALLREAKALGDVLIVGVYSDEVATSFKRKPILGQGMRMAMLEELKCVDTVVTQNTYGPSDNVVRYGVAIVAKGPGAGWDESSIPKFKSAKSILLNYHEGISTSMIIKKIKEDL